MQIIFDTANDDIEEMTLGADLLHKIIAMRTKGLQIARELYERDQKEWAERGSIKVSDIVNVEKGPLTGVSDGDEMLPVSALFGAAPLPDGAIAIDMPESFTQPTETTDVVSAPASSTESVPPAPTTVQNTASPATTIAAGTVDARGYPWDKRIHSTPASINKSDGLWRNKRGLSVELKTQVETELRAQGFGVPAGTQVPPPPPGATGTSHVPTPVPPPPPSNVVPFPPAPSVPVPPPPATAPVVPSAATSTQPAPVAGYDFAAKPANYRDLNLSKITPALTSKKVTAPQLMQIAKDIGVAGLQALIMQPDKVPEFAAKLDALMAAS